MDVSSASYYIHENNENKGSRMKKKVFKKITWKNSSASSSAFSFPSRFGRDVSMMAIVSSCFLSFSPSKLRWLSLASRRLSITSKTSFWILKNEHKNCVSVLYLKLLKSSCDHERHKSEYVVIILVVNLLYFKLDKTIGYFSFEPLQETNSVRKKTIIWWLMGPWNFFKSKYWIQH